MRSLQIAALALAAAQTAHAYVDISPFFMYASSTQTDEARSNGVKWHADQAKLMGPRQKLASASSLTSELSNSLSECDSDHYIIISQPGVTAKDYSSEKVAPALAGLRSENTRTFESLGSIAEVVGSIDTKQWEETLKTHCGIDVVQVDASGPIPSYKSFPRAVHVTMPAPSASRVQKDLSQNDAVFAKLLSMLRSNDYVVLYTTTTPGHSSRPQAEMEQYEMGSEQDNLQYKIHIDMKRDLGMQSRDVKIVGNQTLIDGPLFDKYQFFTPGKSRHSPDCCGYIPPRNSG